jgi:hypothetical protein
LGWYSKPIWIRAPAVASCASFHLEVEAPDEIAITRAELTAAASTPLDIAVKKRNRAEPSADVRRNIDYGPVQRAHLHLDELTQGETGVAIVRLRSQPATLLRPALFSSIASMLLLAAVSWRYPAISTNVGSVATILLFVPGLLSAYVVRPREHPMATSLLFGHRVLALTPSACALLAAVVLLLERKWTQVSSGQVILQPSWEFTRIVLWTVTGISAGSVVLILVALRLSSRPPEAARTKHPHGEIGSASPDAA